MPPNPLNEIAVSVREHRTRRGPMPQTPRVERTGQPALVQRDSVIDNKSRESIALSYPYHVHKFGEEVMVWERKLLRGEDALVPIERRNAPVTCIC